MRLYYGTFDADATAYLDQGREWSEQNVKVINVYSNDKDYYVQDAFSKVGPSNVQHQSCLCSGLMIANGHPAWAKDAHILLDFRS